MNHVSALDTHARTTDHSRATESLDLRSAFADMAHGIKKPKRIAWKLYDAARGRSVAPLGSYPAIAEEIAEAGGSFYNITRPLAVMMAHLRRRCGKVSQKPFAEALCVAKRESDEAEVCALTLALEVNCPSASDLARFSKEASEAIVAIEQAKELADDRLSAMGAL